MKLKGCVEDVRRLYATLTQMFSFRPNDVEILTDEPCGIPGKNCIPPTRQNIMRDFQKLIMDSREGDSLWFSFSGHGTQVPDENGDEVKGWDEVLLPCDFTTVKSLPYVGNYILDDDLYELVCQLHPKAKLTVLVDACHSGKWFRTV